MKVDPLRDAEAQGLAAHLAATDGAMSLAEASGYLTAVASAPTRQVPAEWLPSVLGARGFADLLDATEILGLLMRLHYDLIARLDDGARVAPGPEASDEEAAAWCAGYLRRAQTDPRWTADATGVEMIIMVASLATGADLDQPDDGTPDPPLPTAKRAQYRGGLEACVRAIDLYWGARRRPLPPAPVVRAAPKVGRNEPCPCGSGKKAKRCHGLTP